MAMGSIICPLWIQACYGIPHCYTLLVQRMSKPCNTIIIVSDDPKNDCDAVASYVDRALTHLKTTSEVEISKQIWVTDQCRAQFKGLKAFYQMSQRADVEQHVY